MTENSSLCGANSSSESQVISQNGLANNTISKHCPRHLKQNVNMAHNTTKLLMELMSSIYWF